MTGADCLNGCHDLDYGQPDDTVTACTCTPAETLAAVERFNAKGIDVVFVGITSRTSGDGSDSSTFWCFDCGIELFPENVDKQVRYNGFFSGKCSACLDENGVK